MRHTPSQEDQRFRDRFEDCRLPPSEFDHRGHLRLAYVYLAEGDLEAAHARMRSALRRFLRHHGVEPAKYHETLTRAWLMAVRHFMESCAESDSAASFIESDPRMLDPEIMLTHYSAERLFSDEARSRFVEPDRSPIPRHER